MSSPVRSDLPGSAETNGSRRIKVLYFIDNLDSGGTQRQLVLLLNNLEVSQIEATVCTYQPTRDFFLDSLDASRVKIVSIPKKRKLEFKFLASLVRFLRQRRFDLLHCFLRSSNVWGCLGGRIAGVPRIVASERRADFGRSIVDRVVTSIVLRTADHIATNSQFARDSLIRSTRIAPERTSVIYNGIPPMGCTGEPPTSGFVLSMAATFDRNKNHRCVVEAFDRAFEHLPQPACLRLLGNEQDGLIRRDLEQLIAGRPCERAVEFLGRRVDVAEVFSSSHGVVLASFHEAFPNVLLEAMLCKRPVLASDVSENPFIVGPREERGMLFDPRIPEELCGAMLRLSKMSPRQRRTMGEQARSWVRANFSTSRMVAETVDLYRRLLEVR